ncbi:transglutaminase domain-containing protein [Paenibacillus physcomitrellae]|uniref:Peptidase n=1 Tax=Paenibacillus physcomitrellae TaxID=1619311 RepID=A0ABQ1GUJ2_9BACL|nr:transglutaminase domain-containing protein [Paenibacillus physcomitrellae]GGA50391.1 peptidase [Paenibacillus physcomitrellae]
MRRLQSIVWKAIVVGSFAVAASPAGAVGSPSVHQTEQTAQQAMEQAVLVSKSGVEQRLTTAIQAHLSTVKFKYEGSVKDFESLLDEALMTALDNAPYMRYIMDRYHYSWRGNSAAVNVEVTFTYRESPEQTAYVDDRVKDIIGQIIVPGMNSHEKVKAIHDWVVQDLKYDEKLKNYTAYSGLVTGEAVCQGYTLLTYKLLEKAGIRSLIAEGTAGDQAHAWNLVNLDGHWYHLDTTWDDPVQAASDNISYDYYLLSDAEMSKDHSWTKSYPAADQTYRSALDELKLSDSAKSPFYEKLEQELDYTLYNAGQAVSGSSGLMAKAREALKQGKSTATVRYSGQQSELINDLGELYGLNIRNITFSTRPLEGTDDLKVRIEWEN